MSAIQQGLLQILECADSGIVPRYGPSGKQQIQNRLFFSILKLCHVIDVNIFTCPIVIFSGGQSYSYKVTPLRN